MAQAKQNNAPWLVLTLFGLLAWGELFGKTKEDKEGEAETEKLETAPIDKNPFLIKTYKCAKKKGMFRFTLTTAQATKAASSIDAGIGTVSDDEAMIMNGIKMAATKPDIYFIASMYSRVYKRDLYTRLEQNLNKNKELGNMVNKYINRLPDYSKKGTQE